MASSLAEITWLTGLFPQLNVTINKPITVFSDSKSAIQLESNPIFHEKPKYIEIEYHFIKEKIKEGLVQTVYVPTNHQLGDILSKSFSQDQYLHLLCMFGMLNILHPLA